MIEEILQAMDFKKVTDDIWYNEAIYVWVCRNGARPAAAYDPSLVYDFEMITLPVFVATIYERAWDAAYDRGHEAGYMIGNMAASGCL